MFCILGLGKQSNDFFGYISKLESLIGISFTGNGLKRCETIIWKFAWNYDKQTLSKCVIACNIIITKINFIWHKVTKSVSSVKIKLTTR